METKAYKSTQAKKPNFESKDLILLSKPINKGESGVVQLSQDPMAQNHP